MPRSWRHRLQSAENSTCFLNSYSSPTVSSDPPPPRPPDHHLQRSSGLLTPLHSLPDAPEAHGPPATVRTRRELVHAPAGPAQHSAWRHCLGAPPQQPGEVTTGTAVGPRAPPSARPLHRSHQSAGAGCQSPAALLGPKPSLAPCQRPSTAPLPRTPATASLWGLLHPPHPRELHTQQHSPEVTGHTPLNSLPFLHIAVPRVRAAFLHTPHPAREPDSGTSRPPSPRCTATSRGTGQDCTRLRRPSFQPVIPSVRCASKLLACTGPT